MRRALVIAVTAVLVLALAWLVIPALHGPVRESADDGPATSTPSSTTPSPDVPSPDPSPDVPTTDEPSTSEPTTPPPDPETVADREAGVLGSDVPDAGSGDLVTVPGSTEPPRGDGDVQTVRVEVEEDIDVDADAFAAFVMDTLTDARGWGSEDAEVRVRFAQTDGDADIRVVLATPATVDEMCAPLATNGRWSCGRYGHAALNAQRWTSGTEAFLDAGGDVTAYRHYLINHEVGHLLGHPHVDCPGSGRTAPVMVQQSITLGGCEPNGWPFP